jgi:transaldolase
VEKKGSEFSIWTKKISTTNPNIFSQDIDDYYDFQDELCNYKKILRMSRDN